MLRNYLKIAWRNLIKHRTYSIINIVGLSFSVTFCLLVFFYIRHEQSYDAFHAKKDRLFRLEMGNTSAKKPITDSHLFSFLTKNDDTKNQVVVPLVVGPDMQQHFPEIKSFTRFKDEGEQLVKVGDQVFKQKHIVYAEDNFFRTFSFRLLQGNAATVLKSPQSIVLSEDDAKRYFGKDNPIGKTISFISDSGKIFTVSGVAANAPDNSSIQFGVIIPLESEDDYEENIRERFNHSNHLMVIELAEHVSAAQFDSKMNEWIKKYYVEPFVAENGKYLKDADFEHYRWYIRSLTDCHYNASYWGHYTNANNIYQLLCLVIIILLVASLNYVLIVIANSAARSQEVGIRKVMGASRRSVVLQFWTETQILVIIAVITGLALTRPFLPLFNKLIGSELNFDMLSWREIIPAILSLCILLGLIAGYYPALIISRMKPVSVIKSFSTFKINPRFSKVLIVLQYTCCVTLMIAAFVINRQMHFISNKDLGFDKEQILMVSNPTWDGPFTTRMKNRLAAFARSQPSIAQFSGMNGGLNGSYNNNGFQLNGQQKWMKQLTVDYDYFEMLGLKFVRGRPFSREIGSDTSRAMRPAIVNETLFALLGKDAKLGVYNEAIRATIIGVVKDYHFETLSKKIEPEEHVLTTGYEMYFMFRIKAGQMQPTIAKIEQEWKAATTFPFEFTFLDQTIAQMYEPEVRWRNTIQACCFFAIFIACMGLFGLSAINAVNRMKEIGIRKILGASVTDIVGNLSANFLWMVALSILIATPIAWWIMGKWLEDFAYRIDISWWMFAIVGALALLIAFVATGFQALRAAMANPVDSLRTE